MVENRQPEWSVAWTQCSLAFLICTMWHAHSYNLYGAQGQLGGSSFKKKSVSGGSFVRGKSVKEELNLFKNYLLVTCITNLKRIREKLSRPQGQIIDVKGGKSQ